MEQAPARDLEGITVIGDLDTKGDVRLQFSYQSIIDVSRGQILPLSCEGRVIDGEEHAQGGLADLDSRQRHRLLGRRDRVADLDGCQADDRHDVAGLGLIDLDAAELVEQEHAVDRPGHRHPVRLQKRGLLPAPDLSRDNPADGDPTDILGEVECGAEHGEGAVRLDHRTGHLRDDQVEEGADVTCGRNGVVRGKAGLARGEDVGEIELFLAGPQFHERVKHFVEHLVGPGVGPIHLVDHYDRPDVAGERLAEHKLGLRHRPFEGIDQHECPVGHLERPLHLAAEIRVARRVDQVDLGLAILDGDVLGQDRDPSLALQVVGIKDALTLKLGGPELPGLAKHRIDQRRLSMVHVGDNCHVAYVIASLHGIPALPPAEGPCSWMWLECGEQTPLQCVILHVTHPTATAGASR